MQCLLVKGNKVTEVYGEADIFVQNKDFTRLKLQPELAIRLAEKYMEDKNRSSILIGQLGTARNGIYTLYTVSLDVAATDEKKEMCFYESFQ